jgi:hypothetical protein
VWADSRKDAQHATTSDAWRVAMADAAEFMDVGRVTAARVEEHEIV